MMKKTISAICAFFALAAVLGVFYASFDIEAHRAEKSAWLDSVMASPEYKAQEAAHFARLARMEAAAQKRMEGKR